AEALAAQQARAAGRGIEPAALIYLPEEVAADYAAKTSLAHGLRHGTGDFMSGAVSGQVDMARGATLAGALTADLLFYGDVRDLVVYGCAEARSHDAAPAACELGFLPKPPRDRFVFGLSAVGAALTMGMIATAGATGPADAGVSVLKTAKRGGKMTAGFADTLSKTVAKAAPPDLLAKNVGDVLKTAGKSAPNPAKLADDLGAAAAKSVSKAGIAELAGMAGDAGALAKAAGKGGGVRMLDAVENASDLRRLRHVAEAGGSRALVLHHKTGARVLKLSQASLKLTAKAARDLAALLAALAGFAVALIGSAARFGAGRAAAIFGVGRRLDAAARRLL
ncbi:MAG: hypothetical protein MI723_19860, partial [Caulobacterales bacterium]|nr:hypothetical protein [Caulobacterales bacterium]